MPISLAFTERSAVIMPTIEDTLRGKQPKGYALLMAMYSVEESVGKSKDTKDTQDIQEAMQEIENLMRHDAFRREHGGLRQIRRGS